VKVGLVPLCRICIQGELGDTHDVPFHVLDAGFPHGTVRTVKCPDIQDLVSYYLRIGRGVICLDKKVTGWLLLLRDR